MRFLVPAAILTLLLPRSARAQDAFETEVYGYETASAHEWELESQLNYVAQGTTVPNGSIAPSDHQVHLALELTRGLTAHWEVAAYVLGAYRDGPGADFAGWRARTRVRAPESWRLPVDVTLGAELEFTRAAYDENAAGLEIRPSLSRRFGIVQLAFNPTVERGLKERGGAEVEGWEFEPSARLGVAVSKSVDVSLEYYGMTGIIGSTLPANRQVHLFYPSVDLRLGEDFRIDFGVGFGTTDAGNSLVVKSRFEIPLE